MLIFADALPGFKTFARFVPLPRRAKELVLCCLIAFVMHLGKMSASQAAGALRTRARHRAQITRFLLRRYWTGNVLQAVQAAVLLLDAEAERGDFFFLVDQTYNGQQGQQTENTFSRANYRPRPKRSQRRQKKYAQRSCHCFVCGLLLTPSGLRIPFFKSYYTKDYGQTKGQAYRTQTQLAADLIGELPLPPAAQVTVLGDTAFDAKVIRQACAARHWWWVVPVNPERVLAGPKGQRPKVRSLQKELESKRLTQIEVHPQRGAFVAQRRVARCRIGPKLKARTYWVHQEKRQVHNVGDVLLVFSTMKRKERGQPRPIQKMLMTNAVHWTAAEVVERYQLRWQIELFFKELKSTLGFGHYRFRRFDKVESWVKLVLLTFLYLEWQRARQLARRGLSAAGRRWWQAQRTYGLCRAVRQQAEQNELALLAKELDSGRGLARLKKLLAASHPTEARIVM
jgi:hypothetical protein